LISFDIVEIDNGYLVKCCFGEVRDREGYFIPDRNLFAFTLQEAVEIMNEEGIKLWREVAEDTSYEFPAEEDVQAELPF
jgi:hypothetical protein